MLIVIFFLLPESSTRHFSYSRTVINIFNFTEIIIQIALSSSLICIFVNKLHQIIVVNENQDALLKVVAKQTVLSTLAAVTTCLWLILASVMDIDWICCPNSPMQTKYILHLLTGVGLMLDCTVNSFAIFLYFRFANGLYQILCKSCNGFCLDYCTKEVTKQRESIKNMDDDETAKLTQNETVTFAEHIQPTDTDS
ncbi:MAG: hypothetical protein GY928_05725 [Colwellia sp.]|nr:hypothetical protein [Colwellia sp.]